MLDFSRRPRSVSAARLRLGDALGFLCFMPHLFFFVFALFSFLLGFQDSFYGLNQSILSFAELCSYSRSLQ